MTANLEHLDHTIAGTEVATDTASRPDAAAPGPSPAPGAVLTEPPLPLGPPAVLVVGVVGLAGATTTALGVAAAASVESGRRTWPVVVDTTGRGDLATRGCDLSAPIGMLDDWLGCGSPGLASVVRHYAGSSSTGIGVMAPASAPLPRWEYVVSVQRHLTDAGAWPVYDGGTSPGDRATAALLADPRIRLVLTVPGSFDAVDRLALALGWLETQFSEGITDNTVVVVTQRSPGPTSVIDGYVRAAVGDRVRAVITIGFDAHLAEGGLIVWHRLTVPTRAAYLRLLRELR